MPSFDVVNRVDLQEIDNAVNITKKEITSRYDFRGSPTTVELNKKDSKITLVVADEMKLRAVQEMLAVNLSKRKVDSRCLFYHKPENTSHGHLRTEIDIKQGIESEIARKVVKIIKDTKLKVQAAIQDDQVRVTGKKIDDLQTVIKTLREANLEIPLQFVNMKS